MNYFLSAHRFSVNYISEEKSRLFVINKRLHVISFLSGKA
ncbi:hypothetical protein CSB69_2314 [Morganella morganii]|nr:hypothetical protein CSB69_2314 [Morganella morganii]EMP50469.1 hypothetical protein C790_02349 [Morganella morganii SC01]